MKNFQKDAGLNRDNLRASLLLYGITDRSWIACADKKHDFGIETLCSDVEQCILGGATMIQFREKSLPHADFVRLGRRVQSVCRINNVPFIVNDDIAAAVEIGADGVHIGQTDCKVTDARKIIGRHMILGVSAGTSCQAVLAEHDGADYIGSGAVFTTATKHDADSVSRDELKRICASVAVPVVAIGGITTDNVHLLNGTGIAGISVISALFGAEDKRRAAEQLVNKSRDLFSEKNINNSGI